MFLFSAEVSPSVVNPPTPNDIWEYVVLMVLSGGGAVAVRQFVSAYKSWKEMRRSHTKQVEVDRDSVVERVVEMLQEQLDEQNEDYNKRLSDKDRYYSEELQRRSKITEENFSRKDNAIVDLQEENKRLRRLLARYQDKYGYLGRDTGEDNKSD